MVACIQLLRTSSRVSAIIAQLELFTGKVNEKNRQEIWQTADIIFSTPQCVGNDIKKGLYTMADVLNLNI